MNLRYLNASDGRMGEWFKCKSDIRTHMTKKAVAGSIKWDESEDPDSAFHLVRAYVQKAESLE